MGFVGMEEIPGGGIVKGEVSVAVETIVDQERSDFARIGNHASFRRCFRLILLAGLQSQKRKENEGATHGRELRENPSRRQSL